MFAKNESSDGAEAQKPSIHPPSCPSAMLGCLNMGLQNWQELLRRRALLPSHILAV